MFKFLISNPGHAGHPSGSSHVLDLLRKSHRLQFHRRGPPLRAPHHSRQAHTGGGGGTRIRGTLIPLIRIRVVQGLFWGLENHQVPDGPESDLALSYLFSKHPQMKEWSKAHSFKPYWMAKENISSFFFIDFYGGAKEFTVEEYLAAQQLII